jgi:hypothetical protein
LSRLWLLDIFQSHDLLLQKVWLFIGLDVIFVAKKKEGGGLGEQMYCLARSVSFLQLCIQRSAHEEEEGHIWLIKRS